MGYEGIYQVSSYGRIRSLDRTMTYSNGNTHFYKGHIIHGFVKPNGYKAVDLSNHMKKEKKHVHRLVAEAFIPNPENKPEVNHLDEDKLNNRADNLAWVTSSENKNWGTSIERANKTRRKIRCAFKPVDQFTLDGEFIERHECIADAERKTGIDRKTIYNSCRDKHKQKYYIFRFAS